MAEPQALRQVGHPHRRRGGLGLDRKGLAYNRGAMITRELPKTEDLSVLAERHDERLKDPGGSMASAASSPNTRAPCTITASPITT